MMDRIINMQQPSQWPSQPNIKTSEESEKEAKATKSVLATNIIVERKHKMKWITF